MIKDRENTLAGKDLLHLSTRRIRPNNEQVDLTREREEGRERRIMMFDGVLTRNI